MNSNSPPSALPWFRPALALFRKDALSESRGRTALNASLLFAVTSLVAVAFSLGPAGAPPRVLAALFWIVLFFGATAGLSRSFVKEEESGTALALRLSGSGTPVLMGKILANLTLMGVLEIVVLPLFLILLPLPVGNWGGFFAVLTLGTIGLGAAATIAAAVVAKARGRGELFAVLAFPLLIPGLIGSIAGTQACLVGARGDLWSLVRLLIAYDGLLLTVSFMVFNVLWEE